MSAYNPSATTTTSFDAGLAYLDDDANRPLNVHGMDESATVPGRAMTPGDQSKPDPLKKKKPDSEGKDGEATTDAKADGKPSTTLANHPPPAASTASATSPPRSPPLDHQRIPPGSPHSISHAFGASSPHRRFRSSSPHPRSPASSQIFERNVQEAVVPEDLPRDAIPAHIQTEDHIPPVLEASSLAITDDHLNPDEVEIVMHSAHQPAAAAVAAGTDSGIHSTLSASLHSAHHSPISSDDLPPLSSSLHDSLPPTTLPDPAASPDACDSYAAVDGADPRRLSFISFADVVQAEHFESAASSLPRESLFLPLSGSPLAHAHAAGLARSPSPVARSQASVSSVGAVAGGSPPPVPGSGAASVTGVEMGAGMAASRSPPRPLVLGSRTGSPLQGAHGGVSPPLSGELMVETMSQALRRTGSGDLREGLVMGMGRVAVEDGVEERGVR